MEDQKITDTVKVEAESVPGVTLRDVVNELDDDDEPKTVELEEEVNLCPRGNSSPKHQARHQKHNTNVEQELPAENKMKQAIDRMLLCYCRMQDHADEHEDDFSESEVEAVTDMAIDLLVRVFPRLQGRSDEQTRTKALNYLKIYFELFKLKQIETRRQLFLDEFTDVIRLGEMEDFFVETSLEMAKPIQQFSAQLDAQVNSNEKKQKSKSRRN